MGCMLDRECLALYLHDDLEDAVRRSVEAHVAECEECRQTLGEYRRNAKAVASLVATTTHPPLASRSRRSPWRPFAAAAAVVLAALLVLQAPALAEIVEWVRVRLLSPEETAQVLRDLEQVERPPLHLITEDQVEALVGAPLLKPAYLPPGYVAAPDLNVTEPWPRVHQFFVWTGPRSASGYGDGIWIIQGPSLEKAMEWQVLRGGKHRTITVGGEQALLITGRADYEKGTFTYKPERGYTLAFHWGNQFVVVSTYQGRMDMDRGLPLEELIKVAESLPR